MPNVFKLHVTDLEEARNLRFWSGDNTTAGGCFLLKPDQPELKRRRKSCTDSRSPLAPADPIRAQSLSLSRRGCTKWRPGNLIRGAQILSLQQAGLCDLLLTGCHQS